MAIAPNVIVTGTLEYFWSNSGGGPSPDSAAFVVLSLHGYGSQIPRISGQAFFQDATGPDTVMTANGEFELMVYSNDIIEPAGTYYTLTTKNSNGDILQVNAYRFIGGGQYDLSTLDPYDPNQPPPPLPPLITNLLLVMPWAANLEFPCDQYLSFRVTLGGDTTTQLVNQQPGNLYTWIIQQDSIGGHSFTWPSNSYNMPVVNPAPNGVTVVTAVMGQSFLWPIGPATWMML